MRLQEAWNDALKFKQDALAAFRLGYMGLPDRATAEQLTWACADAIAQRLPKDQAIPEELAALNKALAGNLLRQLVDLSLSTRHLGHRSAVSGGAHPAAGSTAQPDWPTSPTSPAIPMDDLDRFIGDGQPKQLLELHELDDDNPYLIGLFLSGAYQEVMGNLHNLFGTTNAVHIRLSPGGSYRIDHVVRGDTNANVLEAMEHDPRALLERLRVAAEAAINDGQLRIDESRRLPGPPRKQPAPNHVPSRLRQRCRQL